MLERIGRTVLISTTSALLAALATPATAQSVEDEDITNHINGAFIVSSAVDSHRIDVSTDDGVVTLSGTVNNVLEKRRAVDVARATVGVESVRDRIRVRPTDRSDEAIRSDARKALLADPAADSFEVAVRVKDGVATLTGNVDSWAEKRLSETVVAGVRGVTRVHNRIDVNIPEERPDAEIRGEVARRLASTVTVDDALIDVRVDDGAVTLDGTVGSAAEKWSAFDLAWVAGVSSVSVDELEIDWWARDELRRTSVYDGRSDRGLRDAIEQALLYDPRVDSYEVNIEVNDHVATLTGTVSDLRAREAATDLAESTIGVWDVRNHLRIDSPPELSDEDLETDVRAALLRDVYVDRFDITVAVVNGHAHLYGDVDTLFEKQRAGRQAASIEGIVDVSNYLDVGDSWDVEEDWEIAEDIRDELFWSPFVSRDEVTVTVVDGVATLTGTVDTLSERAAAVENAYEGGARLVDNDLLVSYGPEEISR